MKKTILLCAFGSFLFSCGAEEQTEEVNVELKQEIESLENENEELGEDISTLQEKEAELDAVMAELDSLLND